MRYFFHLSWFRFRGQRLNLKLKNLNNWRKIFDLGMFFIWNLLHMLLSKTLKCTQVQIQDIPLKCFTCGRHRQCQGECFLYFKFFWEVGDKYQPIFYCHTWAKLLDLSINFDADSLFTNQTKFFHTRKHCFKSRHCILQPGLFSWSPTNHHGPIEWYFSRRPLWHLSQTKFCSILWMNLNWSMVFVCKTAFHWLRVCLESVLLLTCSLH